MNSSKFQLAITGFFAAFIVIGMMIFAFGGRGSSVPVAQIVIWGSLPELSFKQVFAKSSLSNSETIKVTYVQKNPKTFDAELVEALASGTGPDLMFITQDSIWKNNNKIFTIPFTSYPERSFRDTFAEEGELFLMSTGPIAIPFSIDPLIMYWNRDIFTDANLTAPPSYWDEFFALSQSLTQKDGSFNIIRATAPLGEFQNINNAKEIMAALMLQAGTPIVTPSGNTYRSAVIERGGADVLPSEAAVSFYTEFSNAAKPFYTWNRSLSSSQSMFLSGDLAVYFGLASEASYLKLKNPNLNFDVAPLPQSRTGGRKITFGKMTGLAILKNSKNIGSAFAVANELTSQGIQKEFTNISGIPSARRDLLARPGSDSLTPILYSSALYAKAWMDPNNTQTDVLFQNLIESITSGRERVTGALSQFSLEIDNLFAR